MITTAMRRLALCALLLGALSAAADCVLPQWERRQEFDRAASRIHAIDLTGDQRAELVGHTTDSIFVAINDGTGTFAQPVDVQNGTIIANVVPGEFTGDGDNDLAFSTNGMLSVLPGNGDGTFGAAIDTTITITPANLIAAKLDPGASLDLLVLDPVLDVLVRYTNDGSGQFAEASRTTVGDGPVSFTAADFDADGATDAVVSYPFQYWETAYFHAFFGDTAGAFGNATVVVGRPYSDALQAADLNADGRPDLLTRGNYWFRVYLAGADRTFAAPIERYSAGSTMISALNVADFNGDGVADGVYASEYCSLAFIRGVGTGEFDGGLLIRDGTNCPIFTPADAATADFDGDGRIDAVLAARPESKNILRTYRNRCGDSRVHVDVYTPQTWNGDPATVRVWVLPVESFTRATGSITIRKNGEALATEPISTSSHDALLTFEGLTPGANELVAVYSGDENYDPAQSEPFTITVSNESTTTTLNITPAEVPYGHSAQIAANITATNGQPVTGKIRIAVDGATLTEGNAPAMSVSSNVAAAVGTHTVTASYLGRYWQPKSSTSSSYTVVRQTPTLIATTTGSSSPSRSGFVTISLQWTGSGAKPTGPVTISRDPSPYASQQLNANVDPVTLVVPALPPGTYTLRADYLGDENYAPAFVNVTYTVQPLAAESVVARGTPDGILVYWNSSKPLVARSTPGGPWTTTCCPIDVWGDNSALPSTVYLYRMQAQDGSATVPDVAQRVGFTDDPLLPGMTVKAIHLQEIQSAANAIRTAAGLAPLNLSFTSGAPITASAVIALRTGINEARAALGAYEITFTNTIAAGLPVLANDIQELREAVR